MNTDLKISLSPRRPALLAGTDNSVDVLVRIQSPARPGHPGESRRPDLNIALVIDCSGSMRGAAIDEARRAAAFVVDHLGPRDRCGIFGYSGEAETLVDVIKVADRSVFRDAIGRLDVSGSTNLHAGWLLGAERLAPFAGAGCISRIMLISDGRANAGLTDAAAITTHVGRLADTGVTTSTLGLGNGFNEALMTSMAQAGLGQAHYGDTAEDLMGPFRMEFDLLNAIAARNLTCVLTTADGIGATVLNLYPADAVGRLRLPDIAWGSEVTLAVRLTVPAELACGGVLDGMLTVMLSHTDMQGIVHRTVSGPLMLPVVDADGLAGTAEDANVVARFAEVDAAAVQDQARRAAQAGNWAEVERLLGVLRPMAAASPWLAAVLAELEGLAQRRDGQRLSKEAMYAAMKMRSRLSALEEDLDFLSAQDVASFLRRKGRQGKDH